MKKLLFSVVMLFAGLMILATPSLANERTDGFVCPVIKTDSVLNSPKGKAIGEGHYTIIGPDVMVPEHATNMDGEGTPPGPHSMPGDTDYTAIWAVQ